MTADVMKKEVDTYNRMGYTIGVGRKSHRGGRKPPQTTEGIDHERTRD